MTKDKKLDNSFFKGLQALSDASFPKECMNCGNIYETVEEYVKETESIRGSSGLRESLDDDDKPIVELFRNCKCGSTLMDEFNNRRNLSKAGRKRRKKFGELLDKLVNAGYDVNVAREELLKIVRGEDSILLLERKK